MLIGQALNPERPCCASRLMAASAADSTELDSAARVPALFNRRAWARVGGALGGGISRLHEWGDEFERRHFDGDLIGSLDRTVEQFGERATRVTEQLGAATVKLVEQAKQGESEDLFVEQPRLLTTEQLLVNQAVPVATKAHRESAETAASLWEEAQRLQEEISSRRENRLTTVEQLRERRLAVRDLREKVVEERRRLELAQIDYAAAETRLEQVERDSEVLHDRHHHLVKLVSEQKAELRRLSLANSARQRASDQAAREAAKEGPRAWARVGPETEALTHAKVALAEVLSRIDEAQLQSRKELAQLQKEVVAEKAHNARLRAGGDYNPQSFTTSLWTLFSVAAGREGG